MSIFQDREKAAERRFERDQEQAFKIAVRRNKLLGLWVARRVGLAGAAAERFAMGLVEAHVTDHDEGPIIRSVCAELVVRGTPLAEDDVRRRAAEFARTARAEVVTDPGA
jgi:hypothetical protein